MEPTPRLKKSVEMLANRFKKAYKDTKPTIEINYHDDCTGDVTVTFPKCIHEEDWEEYQDKAREVAGWDDTPYYSDLESEDCGDRGMEAYFVWGVKVAKTVSVYK